MILRRLNRNSEPQASIESGAFTLQYVLSSSELDPGTEPPLLSSLLPVLQIVSWMGGRSYQWHYPTPISPCWVAGSTIWVGMWGGSESIWRRTTATVSLPRGLLTFWISRQATHWRKRHQSHEPNRFLTEWLEMTFAGATAWEEVGKLSC